MVSSITDRIYGESSTVGVKAPCVAVATIPNPLSGLGSIGTYGPNAGDRILVTAQADPTTNGIYDAAAGAWARSGDMSSTNQIVQGTLVVVYNPTMGQGIFYQLITENPAIGSTPLNFATFANPNLNYDLIEEEVTLGVNVVNFTQQPASVERYGINAIPGASNMAPAWNAALTIGIAAGIEVTYGSSGQHLVTSPINGTSAGLVRQAGLSIRNVGNTGIDGQTAGGALLFSIIARHNGEAVFDFTGNDSVLLDGVTITTDPVTYPVLGILTARNSGKASLYFRAYDCRVMGSFLLAPYYNYGSEDDCLINCYWFNHATTGNTKTRCYTSTNNVFNVTSAFTEDPFGNALSIATGTVSCIEHNVFSNLDYNGSGNSEEIGDCVYLDMCDSYKSFGGWADCTGPVACPTNSNPLTGGGVVQAYAVAGLMTVSLVSGTFTGALGTGMQIIGAAIPVGTVIQSFASGTGGVGTYNIVSGPGASTTWGSSGAPIAITAGHAGRALILVDMTNGPSSFGVVHGLTGEDGAPLSKYGIAFNNPNAVVNQPVGWDIQGCKLPAAGYAISVLGAGAADAVLNSCAIRNIEQGGLGYGCNWPGTVNSSRIDVAIPFSINIATNSKLVGDQVNQISVATMNGGSRDHIGAQPTFTGGIVSGVNGWTFTGAAPTLVGKYNWIANEIDFSLRIVAGTQVSTSANATFAAPGTSTDEFGCEVIDATSGTLLSMAIWSGATVTIPTAISATGHVIIIKGRGAVS